MSAPPSLCRLLAAHHEGMVVEYEWVDQKL
jgi:hypothetical protein